MQIVVLGSSSGVPTLRRNLSSTALCFESEVLLFDCGEGTQMQLKRAGIKTSRIARIFISHMHGDHVNGLMGLLMTMDMEDRQEPLYLHGPESLERMIAALKRFLRTNVRYEIAFQPLVEDGHALACEDKHYLVESAPLQHRIPCHGFAIQERTKAGRFNVERARELGIPPGPLFGELQRGGTVTLADGRVITPDQVLGDPRPGRRMAYVLDTRPCENGVRLARGADTLLHEATFAEELQAKAVDTGHSTAREAAEVAARAGAVALLLTHFSPRYLSTTPLYREARAVFEKVRTVEDLHRYEIGTDQPGQPLLPEPEEGDGAETRPTV